MFKEFKLLVNIPCYKHLHSLRSVKAFAEPIVKIALKNERKLLNKKVHFRCAVFWSKKGIFWSNRVLPGLTRHRILSRTFMEQSGKTISWSNRRMGLRVKPAMTQKMSDLASIAKDLARKRGVPLMQKTAVFVAQNRPPCSIKWGDPSFFWIIYCRGQNNAYLCVRKVNLFVEQSCAKKSSLYNTKNQSVTIKWSTVEHHVPRTNFC